jgi:glycosyltransferase involved in cell wall biosynthesis
MTNNETDTPEVSVALLTYNAGPLLQRVLDTVAAQDTPRRIEIVVVDSGSTDGTVDLLKAAGACVESIPHDTFNFGRARDQVFGMARGEIVVSLSQDAIPAHERWLENLLVPLAADSVAVSCGRSNFDAERNTRQFPWERNGYFYFTREMQRFRERHGPGLSNANAAYLRSVWKDLGFGTQPIGEDFRFQTKLEKLGQYIAFPSDAPVLHHHDYTLRTLWRRCAAEGHGLRLLDCAYTPLDLIIDLASPRKFLTAFREFRGGTLRSPADFLFPILRPLAVFTGAHFHRGSTP